MTVAGGNILLKVQGRPLYALFFLKFSFPIEFDFELEYGEFVHSIKEGATGILLVVEFSLLSRVPAGLPSSIS